MKIKEICRTINNLYLIERRNYLYEDAPIGFAKFRAAKALTKILDIPFESLEPQSDLELIRKLLDDEEEEITPKDAKTYILEIFMSHIRKLYPVEYNTIHLVDIPAYVGPSMPLPIQENRLIPVPISNSGTPLFTPAILNAEFSLSLFGAQKKLIDFKSSLKSELKGIMLSRTWLKYTELYPIVYNLNVATTIILEQGNLYEARWQLQQAIEKFICLIFEQTNPTESELKKLKDAGHNLTKKLTVNKPNVLFDLVKDRFEPAKLEKIRSLLEHIECSASIRYQKKCKLEPEVDFVSTQKAVDSLYAGLAILEELAAATDFNKLTTFNCWDFTEKEEVLIWRRMMIDYSIKNGIKTIDTLSSKEYYIIESL